MPDYSKCIIYQIKCLETGEVYIGSTTQTLQKRMNQHKCCQHLRPCSSKAIIERGNYKEDVLLYCSCKDRKELHRIEGNFIIAEPNCINYQRAGRTHKDYYNENREHYLNLRRNRYIYDKEHNLDRIKQQSKRSKDKRKDKIKVENNRIRLWRNSWAGDPRYNNNLLSIKV